MTQITKPNAKSPTASASSTDLGFDPDALKKKYLAERDKRLRQEGSGQYVRPEGELAKYAADPYATPNFTRAPLTDEVDVAVIGAGFAGLLTGVHLREAGIKNIRIIEKGADFGGTWYWNRYPGVACDVEAYVYMPMLEEMGYIPTEKYARGSEIQAHCRKIAEKYDLYKNACFQTEVKALRWDDKISRWIISTNHGDAIRARYIVTANGPLNQPKLPRIPGVQDFKGHSFHTCRWDYAYTGGDFRGNLTGLKDKRVGLIGTGATAIQCVPHLGEWAKHLYVFQRTPSSVDTRDNRPTDANWAKSLTPGWQRKRMDNFNTIISGGYQDEDLVNDGWTYAVKAVTLFEMKKDPSSIPADPTELMQIADFKKMESVRTRVDSIVKDKATAEALKPYYNQMCKRPCFSDEYLQTFNRPNVTLVDTDGKGVDRITEKGIVVKGREYELDCLIYGTGFENSGPEANRSNYEIYGRGGVSLTEKWKDGMSSLHGVLSRGFPNCFMISPLQSAYSVNYLHVVDIQSIHIAKVIKECASRDTWIVEPSQKAEDAWVDRIVSTAGWAKKFFEECTPGYYNNEGKSTQTLERNTFFGPGPVVFQKLLEDWRAEGKLEGLELSKG